MLVLERETRNQPGTISFFSQKSVEFQVLLKIKFFEKNEKKFMKMFWFTKKLKRRKKINKKKMITNICLRLPC